MDVLRFKQANCKTCYKCVRFCPVKSIRVYQGHAQIISSDCILCGNCVSVCPQHAKEDISDVAQIQKLIASGQQVVVSVDSSYIAYFDTPGFSGIEEPLKLAYMVAFGYPTHKAHIVPLTTDTGVKYYLDENRDYCVPKRSAEEIARSV